MLRVYNIINDLNDLIATYLSNTMVTSYVDPQVKGSSINGQIIIVIA